VAYAVNGHGIPIDHIEDSIRAINRLADVNSDGDRFRSKAVPLRKVIERINLLENRFSPSQGGGRRVLGDVRDDSVDFVVGLLGESNANRHT
jgi:hypothetical protein